MRVLIERAGDTQAVDVEIGRGEPVIADLLRALGIDEAFVDNRAVAPNQSLGSLLFDGLRLSTEPDPVDTGARRIAGVAGPVAGRRWWLGEGTHRVGRGTTVHVDEPTISREHCTMVVDSRGAVTVDDDGSHNGTEIDGRYIETATKLDDRRPLRLGASILRLEPAVDPRRVPISGEHEAGPNASLREPFNRPPRAAPEPRPSPPSPPPPPVTPVTPTPLSIVRLAVPILMGLTMAAMFHPRMALFAFLSPVMVISTWVAGRRTARRENRLSRRAFRVALQRFARDAERAQRDEEQWERAAHPDIAETLLRTEHQSRRLWERRSDHLDFGALSTGLTSRPWDPGFDDEPPAECLDVLSALGPLAHVPAVVDATEVIGIVGPRSVVLSVARSLIVQLAVHHGPADVEVAIVALADRAADWEWATWLPHNHDVAIGGCRPLMASTAASIEDLFDRTNPACNTMRWLIVDDAKLTRDRRSPTRAALADRQGASSGLVLADRVHDLPACCRTVITIGSHGVGTVDRPHTGENLANVHLTGLGASLARRTASRLARLDDPEAGTTSGALPESVRLVDLLDPSIAAVESRWANRSAATSLSAPIGVSQDGRLSVDFVADGPHGLVAGTTGSGKSELLRTIVCALAATYSPAHLNLILVDYKGGSAFDACSALPHAVGTVTDLDDGLAARALCCLEAELHHRERIMRRSGVSDLAELLSSGESLPRLMVIVDEFATLAAELPEFMDALVDVAQRGRSLGVHLLLATQRPGGALKENIRTNTNLRVALRLIGGSDSLDVIDDKVAASIDRRRPGRAYARFGPSELSAFQAAIVSIPRRDDDEPMLHVRRLTAGFPEGGGREPAEDRGSDLAYFVETITEAWNRSDLPEPRRPWPDPLPNRITTDQLDTTGEGLAIGLCDEPQEQRQRTWSWFPETGHLLCYGGLDSGTADVMRTIALLACRRSDPDTFHIHALDFGTGELSTLARLPHAGAIIMSDERERQARLVDYLHQELRDRKASREGNAPTILCLIENWSALIAEFDGYRDAPVLHALERIFADGAALGIHLAVSADRPGALSATLTATSPNRLVFALADQADYANVGMRGVDASSVPALRCRDLSRGIDVQIAHDPDPSATIDSLGHRPPRRCPPRSIGVLPHRVELAALAAPTPDQGAASLVLTIGLAGDTLEPIRLCMYPGDHALVLGPSRAGRSSALATIGAAARTVDPTRNVAVIAPRRSPLPGLVTDALHVGPAELPRLLTSQGPLLVLVDDADIIDDEGDALGAIIDRAPDGVHVVAATRPERLRGGFRHWTHDIRRSRLALLLRPDDTDGDLFGARLDQRDELPPIPGRGVLIADGTVRTCQVAVHERTR